ncbi:MAG: hypothetical protein RIF34_09845 [Candidatus Kapaibacterium sp.]
MKYRIICVLILTAFLGMNAQNQKLDENLITGDVEQAKDTLCHFYSFSVGDTLEYRVESGDSIVVNWESYLTKERFDRIRIVCDKIDKKTGHFFLSYEYIDFIGSEFKPLYEKVERKEHPWLNKKVILEIDSFGRRYSYSYMDTTSKGFTSGGPFQGSLIQPIGTKCSTKGSSTILQKDTAYFAENGFQTPKIVMTYLIENMGEVDTLDYNSTRVDLSTTGNGEVFIESKEAMFYMSSVINGHVENYISNELHIPIWQYFTQEQNFTMELGKGKKTKGFHYTYSIYNLDRYVSGKVKQKNNKKKAAILK